MRASTLLVGALVAINLTLVGLLLFRDRSVAPALAEGGSATAVATKEVAAEPQAPPLELQASTIAGGVGGATSGTEPPETRVIEPVAAPHIHTRPELESIPAKPETAPAAPPAERPVTARPRRTEAPATERTATNSEPNREPSREPNREPSRASYEPPSRGGLGEPPVEVAREPRPSEAPRVVRPRTVAIAAGTHLPITLDVGLHSRQVEKGDRFEASLAQDLVVEDRVVARAGSPVTGRLLEVIQAGKTKGVEHMKLTLSDLSLNGKSYQLESSTVSLSAEKETEKDAAIIGGSTVVGAILGGIAKGGKGAAVGAAAGAAAGTGVVLSTRGKPVVLAAGTRLDFTLEEALRVTLPGDEREPEPLAPLEKQPRDGGGIVRK